MQAGHVRINLKSAKTRTQKGLNAFNDGVIKPPPINPRRFKTNLLEAMKMLNYCQDQLQEKIPPE